MKKGDRAFFCHFNEGKEIVGIAEIVQETYPDPSDNTGQFVCVDIRADKPLKTPVAMAAIKVDKKLADSRGLPCGRDLPCGLPSRESQRKLWKCSRHRKFVSAGPRMGFASPTRRRAAVRR
jgi:predicted RNA-binding protein with PUA-like domain